HAPPRPAVSITSDHSPWKSGISVLSLGFQYGAVRIPSDHRGDTIFDGASVTLFHRDRDAERAARDRLVAAGARPQLDAEGDGGRDDVSAPLTIAQPKLGPLIVDLVREGR